MRFATVPLALSLGLGLAFAAATALLATSEPGAFDAVAQYAAARLVASGRPSAVLDPDAILAVEREAVPSRATLLPFVQPPVTALVLAPLGTLPFGTAYAVMAALAAAAIAAALATAPRPRSLSPMIAATLLVAPPSVLAVAHAQTSAIVVLLVALSLRSLAWPGGIALGLTLLRPQTAPLLLLAGMADPRRRDAGTSVRADRPRGSVVADHEPARPHARRGARVPRSAPAGRQVRRMGVALGRVVAGAHRGAPARTAVVARRRGRRRAEALR